MSLTKTSPLVSLESILQAHQRLKGVAKHTPLEMNAHLSEQFGAEIWLKREDLQKVRSYKIRGAYNKMSTLNKDERDRGIVCASAGNHAQGVALSCKLLEVQGKIFMPETTPRQKVRKVARFGEGMVEIILTGDTFDDASRCALWACQEENKTFIHPFDDPDVIAGQGTIGPEMMADCPAPFDYMFVPIGGGGLASGLGTYLKKLSPHTKLIGVEPAGAPAMYNSLQAGKRVILEDLDKFVDGAAVMQVGTCNFEICKEVLDDLILVPEGMVCSTILQLYDEEAIVTEPAGALAIAALNLYADKIKDKRVGCIVSGSNNDITRTAEIRERALLYQGLKHYFIINFPQRSGALKDFVGNVLGPKDDIALFEYIKRNGRESGPALIGIELEHQVDYKALIGRMDARKVSYRYVNDDPSLFHLLV